MLNCHCDTGVSSSNTQTRIVPTDESPNKSVSSPLNNLPSQHASKCPHHRSGTIVPTQTSQVTTYTTLDHVPLHNNTGIVSYLEGTELNDSDTFDHMSSSSNYLDDNEPHQSLIPNNNKSSSSNQHKEVHQSLTINISQNTSSNQHGSNTYPIFLEYDMSISPPIGESWPELVHLLHNDHAMLTRAKTGKSNPKVIVAHTKIEPTSVKQALSKPEWVKAM